MRFISLRNEQAAAYAATAYGFLTRKPGVVISVGGPGMFHVIAGVSKADPKNHLRPRDVDVWVRFHTHKPTPGLFWS